MFKVSREGGLQEPIFRTDTRILNLVLKRRIGLEYLVIIIPELLLLLENLCHE